MFPDRAAMAPFIRLEMDPDGHGVVADDLGPFATFPTIQHARKAIADAEQMVAQFFNAKQRSQP